MPNACVCRYIWHKYNRNWEDHPDYKSFIATAKNTSVLARVEINMLLQWLWYFERHSKSVEEVDFVILLLNYYLNADQEEHFAVLKEGLRGKLRECATKCMADMDRIFDAYYSGITLGLVTSGTNKVIIVLQRNTLMD